MGASRRFVIYFKFAEWLRLAEHAELKICSQSGVPGPGPVWRCHGQSGVPGRVWGARASLGCQGQSGCARATGVPGQIWRARVSLGCQGHDGRAKASLKSQRQFGVPESIWNASASLEYQGKSEVRRPIWDVNASLGCPR